MALLADDCIVVSFASHPVTSPPKMYSCGSPVSVHLLSVLHYCQLYCRVGVYRREPVEVEFRSRSETEPPVVVARVVRTWELCCAFLSRSGSTFGLYLPSFEGRVPKMTDCTP